MAPVRSVLEHQQKQRKRHISAHSHPSQEHQDREWVNESSQKIKILKESVKAGATTSQYKFKVAKSGQDWDEGPTIKEKRPKIYFDQLLQKLAG